MWFFLRREKLKTAHKFILSFSRSCNMRIDLETLEIFLSFFKCDENIKYNLINFA